MILELHPSPARTAVARSAATRSATSQPLASPTTAELEQELAALRGRIDELAEEVHARRAPAGRRRTESRRRGALAQERRELRARHEQKALEHLFRAGLNRLV